MALASLAALVAAVYPLIAPQPFVVFLLMLIFFFGVVATFYNLLIGYGGVFFISPMIFYAVGGYTAGWLSLKGGVNPFAGIIVGGVLAAISSLFFSLLSTRLKGLYMALYSVIFGLLLHSIVVQQDKPWIFYWTGGAFGLQGIPDMELFGVQFRDHQGIPYYYLGLTLLVISLIVSHKLINSRLGLSLRSIRDAETYASTLGVNSLLSKVLGFAVAGFFMGVAGGALAHFFVSVTPSLFDISWVLVFFSIIMLGGIGTFLGPLVGTLILIPINEFLAVYGPWRQVILGLIIILTVLFAPQGIVGKARDLLLRRTAAAPAVVASVLARKASESS